METIDENLEDKKRVLAEREFGERAERLARLNAQVHQLFPGEAENMSRLRADIKSSFDVPQMGEYHNEGMFMDTHLDLILGNLEKTAQGQFPEEVPISIRPTLVSQALANLDVLKKYTYLHDLAKKDRLKLKFSQKSAKDVSWEEWSRELPEDAKNNPVALLEYLRAQQIEGISYYHEGEDSQHGIAGKKQIELLGYDGVSSSVLTAIEKHEVAYSFGLVKPETYGKHLGGLSAQERDLAITASYIDTVSSLDPEGKPDLSNFARLVISKNNFEVIAEVEKALRKNTGLEKKKVESALKKLTELQVRISESPSDLISQLEKKCRPTEYDLEKISLGFQELVGKGLITPEQRDAILNLIQEKKIDQLGKFFGKKMKDLKLVLEGAEIHEQ